MKRLLLILMLLNVMNGFAQTNVVWTHTNPYTPATLIKDHDNNIISVAVDYDIGGVVKYNLNGEVLWTLSSSAVNGGMEDFATFYNRKASVDNENSIYLTLMYTDFSNNYHYNKVVKISSAGDIVWATQHLLNTGAPSGAYYQSGLEVDSQGNVYVYGVDSDQNQFEYTRFLVLKYNVDGVFQWKKSLFNNGLGSIATSLAIDQQDNIIVGGGHDFNSFTLIGSYVLYKFDQNGNQIWQILEENVSYRPYRIIVDDQNNILLLRAGLGLASIVKYNSDGSEIFSIDYGPASTGVLRPDLTPDQNGNFYVTGGYPTANNTTSFKTTKFNSSGQLLWEQIFTPNGNANMKNTPSDASVDDFGNISVVGVSHELNQMNVKYPVIKYDANGNQLWTATAPGTINYAYAPPAVVSIGKYTYVGTPQYSAYSPGILTKYSDSYVVSFYSDCASGPKGTEVLVPIVTRNFNNVVSTQFSITWDPAVASFVGVENFALNGINANSFGISQVDDGVLTFSWNDPSLLSQDLVDDSHLFAIRFSLTGDYDTSTPVSITGEPVDMEVIGLNSGNFAPMEIILNACTISIDPIYFEGQVLYTNSQPVQNATVDLGGSDPQSTQTDQEGYYYFYPNSTQDNASFTLTPSKTDDPEPLNGIDVQDVASIRRHIVQTQLLNSPYRIIAADVNQSHTVTTFDIVLVQALILGIKDNFPNNAQWTFVPIDFQFADVYNPFPYPTNKILSVTSTPINNFIGIKYGDVNNSRDNSQSGRQQQISDVIFETGFPQEENDMVIVPIKVYGFKDVSAYQFTTKWDVENLTYIGIDNGSVAGQFGEQQTGSGMLTTLWDNSEGKSTSLEDGSTLFTLKFKKKSETANVQIELNAATPALVFDGSLSKLNFMIQQGEEIPNESDFAIYPNPFTMNSQANIRLRLSKASSVAVEIITIDGRKLRTMLTEGSVGTNTMVWDGKDDAGSEVKSGLYIVKIMTGHSSNVIKVVKN